MPRAAIVGNNFDEKTPAETGALCITDQTNGHTRDTKPSEVECIPPLNLDALDLKDKDDVNIQHENNSVCLSEYNVNSTCSVTNDSVAGVLSTPKSSHSRVFNRRSLRIQSKSLDCLHDSNNDVFWTPNEFVAKKPGSIRNLRSRIVIVNEEYIPRKKKCKMKD